MEDYTTNPLPMVNESNMKNFVGRYAILHGKVSSVKGNTLFLRIDADTNIDVMVKNFNKNVTQDSVLKIIGKIYPDQSIEYVDHILLSDEFDLKLLNEAIPILHHREVKNLFY